MAFSIEAFEAALAAAVAAGAPRRFLVALSGGLDSTVALHALIESGAVGSVRAIHVDHGLHPDSSSWRDHCRACCAALDVPFADATASIAATPGRSPEEAAREARYACLRHELGADETLVTGHHADDQLETVLLQLLRGAGPAGLAAMPGLASFGRGHLCRPLLGFRRAELAAWADSRGLSWLEDPSNREAGYDRNYLRHEVLPALRRRWPSAARSAVRSARHCAEALDLMEALADADLAPLLSRGRLDVGGVAALAPSRQRNLLRRWLVLRGITVPDARRMDSILRDVMGARADARPEVRWDAGAVRRYRDRLYALDADSLAVLERPGGKLSWDPGQPLSLGPGLGRLRLIPAEGPGLSVKSLEAGPLEVRFRAGGETLKPAGRACTRPLKKLLQEAGVPPWWRDRVPIIYLGHRLLCVADLWIDQEAYSEGPGAWRVSWEERPEIG